MNNLTAAPGMGLLPLQGGLPATSEAKEILAPRKTVDEYLNEVSYAEDPDYVPSAFALKFIDFIKMVTDGKGESSPSPTFHYKMLDNVGTKASRVANLASRGTSKTSLLAEYLLFYIAIYGELDGFGKVNVTMYVSDTMENGVKNLVKNMQSRYDASNFLKRYIPDAKFNQTEMLFKNASGKSSYVRMFGASSGIRGFKYFGQRPQLALFDDLLSTENANSDTILSRIEDMVYKGVMPSLDITHKKVIFSGTPFNAADPLYKAIESPAWLSNVYPIAEHWPCTREEFVGAWPERFSYDALWDDWELALADKQTAAFMQELMLRITNPEDRMIEDTDIIWYSRDALLQQRGNYNFYITTDFANSEQKAADNSSISVWAVSNNGDYYWVDGILKQQLMDKNFDDLFMLAHRYAPLGVGIETNGQQGGYIPLLQKEMIARNIYFPIARSTVAKGRGPLGIQAPTNKSKIQRFNTVLPLFTRHKLFLPEELKEGEIMMEAVKELKGVTVRGIVSRRDDWLDTVSMLGLMQIFTPANGGATLALGGPKSPDSFWGRFNNRSQSGSGQNESYYV